MEEWQSKGIQSVIWQRENPAIGLAFNILLKGVQGNCSLTLPSMYSICCSSDVSFSDNFAKRDLQEISVKQQSGLIMLIKLQLCCHIHVGKLKEQNNYKSPQKQTQL